MNNPRTTCDPEWIESFLEQKLSNEEQSAFESHLSTCDHCRQRLETAAAREDISFEICESLRDEKLSPDGLHSGDSDSTGEDASSNQTTVPKLLRRRMTIGCSGVGGRMKLWAPSARAEWALRSRRSTPP